MINVENRPRRCDVIVHVFGVTCDVVMSHKTRKLDGDKWDEFTIVFEFDDEGEVNGSYGYSYERAVEANAFAVDPDDVSPQVNVYCEFMRIKGDKGMIKMLFQFNRVTRKVNADFEYENPSRWKVTPKNIDTIVEELRPNLW